MRSLSFGRAPYRFMAIQLLLLCGLLVFYRFCLPHLMRNSAEQTAAARERKINTLFLSWVVEDATREVAVPLGGEIVKRHPWKLRVTLSPQEAETDLGIPTTSTTDFRGGQHLTWLGTGHKLTASFNAGRLYSLTWEDRATGHGEMVYESPTSWRPF